MGAGWPDRPRRAGLPEPAAVTLPLVGIALTGLAGAAIVILAFRDDPALWVLGAAILVGAMAGAVMALTALGARP